MTRNALLVLPDQIFEVKSYYDQVQRFSDLLSLEVLPTKIDHFLAFRYYQNDLSFHLIQQGEAFLTFEVFQDAIARFLHPLRVILKVVLQVF